MRPAVVLPAWIDHGIRAGAAATISYRQRGGELTRRRIHVRHWAPVAFVEPSP